MTKVTKHLYKNLGFSQIITGKYSYSFRHSFHNILIRCNSEQIKTRKMSNSTFNHSSEMVWNSSECGKSANMELVEVCIFTIISDYNMD